MKERIDIPLIPPNMEKEARVKKLLEKSWIERYSEEEKKKFDLWKQNIPVSSAESPLKVKNVGDVLSLLPETPNYTKEQAGFFIELNEKITMNSVFEQFVRVENGFELAAQKISDSVFFLSVGGRSHGVGKRLEGTFYAHSHPDLFGAFEIDKEKQKTLPILFNKGVLPSHGDIELYLRDGSVSAEGTRIYSKNGWINIKRFGGQVGEKERLSLEKYRDDYFDLFDGINKSKITTIEETKEYFKNNFQFDLEYHEFDEREE